MDDVHQTLAVIISETRGVDEEKCVPAARLFVDLGLESIDFLEILYRMEEEFGLSYPMDDLGSILNSIGENSTLADVERALEQLRANFFMKVPAYLPGVNPVNSAKFHGAVLDLFTVQSLHDYVIGRRKRDGM